SEPLCRAIVTAKMLDSTKALSMHKALQKAFYSQNKNVTLWDNIKECVSQLGMDTVLFARKYHSEEMRAKTQQEFATVEKNGIAGFPALLLVIDNKTILVTDGYTKFKQLDKKLKSELKLK
ncbi:MAG TPA: DsbA family protein, partial [Cytophagales bacterium]|nr:DsbA family protein [Cytophagales bacterium]